MTILARFRNSWSIFSNLWTIIIHFPYWKRPNSIVFVKAPCCDLGSRRNSNHLGKGSNQTQKNDELKVVDLFVAIRYLPVEKKHIMNHTKWLNHLGVYFTVQTTFRALRNHRCGVRSAVLVVMKVGEPHERRLHSHGARGLRSANQHWGWGSYQFLSGNKSGISAENGWCIGGVPCKKQVELRCFFFWNDGSNKWPS